jgi:threonyl-tRNA synthetase
MVSTCVPLRDGLTRVRRFQQDDAHIFCRPDQMEYELINFLKLMDEVYGVFGLTYEMKLSTRPEGYLGEIEIWDQAEAALKKALDMTGKEWKLNPGDGAFYGPKIDITVFDALKRRQGCCITPGLLHHLLGYMDPIPAVLPSIEPCFDYKI